jgi:PilZ domain.
MAYTNVSESKNLRQHRRYAVDAGSLEVSWLDSTGKMKTARTRALNVSEEGIALELPEPVLPLRVQFQSERFNVDGMGTVRYCRREGRKWVVGLEFTGNLHWSAPQEEVGEPIPLCG